MADYIKPVVFEINGQSYGVDIALVQSIENDIATVTVPNAMPFISGIVNLRGEVIPVYNIKKKFNMAQTNTKCDSAIIVYVNDVKLAIEVDAVLEIGNIEIENIVPMPQIIKQEGTEYLDRVANTGDKLVILLDLEQLLSDDERAGVKKFTEEMSNDN